VVVGKSARGLWRLTGDEAFFAGHFPGRPLAPGVLIVEALAQLSGLVAMSGAADARGGAAEGRLAHVGVRFRQAVAPPAEVRLESRLAQGMGEVALFDVTARVGENVVADGQLALAVSTGGAGKV